MELYKAEIYQFIQHMKDRFNMEIKLSVDNFNTVEHYKYKDIEAKE